MIDTSASYHTLPRRESFCMYQSGQFDVVRMGNNSTRNTVGIGDVKIMTNLGYKLMIKNASHVADLRLSLLSVRRLDDEGFESRFGRGLWKMTKGSLAVASAKKSNTLYKFTAQGCVGQLNIAEKDSNIKLWH